MFSHVLKRSSFIQRPFAPLKTTTTISRWITYDITSDTATQPTDAMFDSMKTASKADDVFGMDETTNELEQRVAHLLGHEAGLFCASGGMTNQLGLRVSLFQPPHSVLVDARSHVNLYECGGLAYHSQASMTAVHPVGQHLSVADIEQGAIQDDLCGALTRVVSVENTLNGTIMPLSQLEAVREHSLVQGYKLHMDGARIWEASAATSVPLAAYGGLCDTVSVCLSKGLGAPIGSVLVSDKTTIRRARHLRKLMGGGWRQSGGLAAAGLYCLDHVLPTMRDTQIRTQRLWQGLQRLGMTTVLPVETNMIFIDTRGIISLRAWAQHLLDHANVRIDSSDDHVARLVMHYQVPDSVVDRILDLTQQFVKLHGKSPMKQVSGSSPAENQGVKLAYPSNNNSST